MKRLKKKYKFIYKHKAIALFIVIILLVILASGYKFLLQHLKQNYIYAEVQVNYPQSAYVDPTTWLIQSLKYEEKQYNLLGLTDAEITGVTYYPTYSNSTGSQYNIYLYLKLKASYNKSDKQYTYQRQNIGIGSSINLNFTSTNILGTVIGISPSPIKKKYIEKTIYLISKQGYTKDFPYFYNNIIVGDKYFDGMNTIFEIENKSLEQNIWTVQNNLNAQVYDRTVDSVQNIVVKAKIKVVEENDELIYGETYPIKIGSSIPFATSTYNFNNFVIASIQ